MPVVRAGDLGAVLVEHLGDGARDRAPDGAGALEPLVRVDEEGAALGRGVVLVEHRAPPLDHRLLDVDRRRRGAVHHPAHRRGVVARLHLGRELEQTVEHGRDHVGVRDAVAIDQAQRFLGVPLVHQHHADAGAERDQQIEAQRRRVVERAGHQRDVRRGIAGGGLAALERAARPASSRACARRPWAGRWCPRCRACAGRARDRRGRRRPRRRSATPSARSRGCRRRSRCAASPAASARRRRSPPRRTARRR